MIKIIKSGELKQNGMKQEAADDTSLRDCVASIIDNVKKHGDEALVKYTKEFDKCSITDFELSKAAIDEAAATVDKEFIKVLEQAAQNIEEFHANQINTGFDLLPKDGVILGQKVTPISRVGCYIPGGSAPYFSSVLMNCIPAKIAGVKEIIIVTPPSKNGVDPRILAAAKIAGVDRVFTVGGAQAIAALAFGTETIPCVDKITGPGNAYVTEAKRQVFGIVGIDMIAGPSDVLVIADKTADPVYIAADMLAQCEHGKDSYAVLITDNMTLAKKVRAEIETQLPALPRKDIAKFAINNNSLIILTDTMEEAFDISNERAPEHLEILLEEPFNYLSKVINAGSIFLGKHTPETLGDYMAGPNHTIPTGGTARFSSPLSVDDFVKKSSYIYFSEDAINKKGADAIRFAKEEGLHGHALAVEKRLKG
ncbi:MAG: histidinol dehydrogenase [Oscillospiraceae bacterium]|nr:histidinol dehydrogenase [Oscillospiraceae bacterium]